MTRLDATQTILIVDDSDDDYEATVRALSRGANLPNPLHRCENGQQALDYLFQRGQRRDDAMSMPGIVLLDLNMPGIDGRRVLAELKTDAKLRRIPVIIMTNSDAERDIDDCYQLGANSYIRKPLEWQAFANCIQRLKAYWFEVAILPKV